MSTMLFNEVVPNLSKKKLIGRTPARQVEMLLDMASYEAFIDMKAPFDAHLIAAIDILHAMTEQDKDRCFDAALVLASKVGASRVDVAEIDIEALKSKLHTAYQDNVSKHAFARVSTLFDIAQKAKTLRSAEVKVGQKEKVEASMAMA